MEIRKKKGISHVEMILSFVIFVGFLIFIFAILNPLKISDEKDIYLNIVERGIRENTSIEFKFLSLSLNHSWGKKKCFWFRYNLSNIIVKNESYGFVAALSRGGGKERKIYINGTGSFFYILSCEEFNESDFFPKGCEMLRSENYTFGLLRKFDMTSYSRLEDLTKRYDSDYEGLKKEIGLPHSKDFSFSVRDTSGKNILRVNKTISKQASILARDVPIQIVYKNGTLKYALLNIQVW